MVRSCQLQGPRTTGTYWAGMHLWCVAPKRGGLWVVGLKSWRSALPALNLEQLRAKTYKCDLAEGGVGKKLGSNWIAGDQFFAHVAKLLD